MLSKTTAYIKSYVHATNWMSFVIEHDELLRKSNKIWNKVNNSIMKVIESKPMHNQKISKN